MIKTPRAAVARITKIAGGQPQGADVSADLGKLLIRGIAGALMVGHGTQKLFGTSGGPGFTGTSQWMESMRMRPGKLWAFAAGTSEAGGGALMGAGALHPLGPILTLSAMVMAFAKGHWGKPIWAQKGGGELAVVDGLIAVEQLLQGPGKYSFDGLLGIKLPRWVAVGAGSAAALSLAYGLWQSRPVAEPQVQDADPAATTAESTTSLPAPLSDMVRL